MIFLPISWFLKRAWVVSKLRFELFFYVIILIYDKTILWYTFNMNKIFAIVVPRINIKIK